MDFAEALAIANAMSIEDRVRLAEAIWDGIAEEQPVPELTEAQKQELDRRLAEREANPNDVVSREEVQAEAEARLAPGLPINEAVGNMFHSMEFARD